jgi:O-antigen/teichoic acid export membrane protein
MVPKDLGGRFLTNADKYIILYFLSPTAVSIYAVSYAAANVVQTFAQMLGPTLYPTVTSEWDDGNITGIRRLYTTIFEWYTFVGMPATVGISILAFPVLRLLSTPVIAREGQMVVALLALGFFIYGYNLPLTFIINAAEKNEELSKITVVAAVANVFLNIILLPLIGIFGAVIATIVAQSATTVYVYYHTRSMIGFEFPLITFGKAAFATGAMAVVLILIPFTLSWQLKLIAFPVLGVLTYLGVFILVGGFSREEIREAIQFVTEDRVIE